MRWVTLCVYKRWKFFPAAWSIYLRVYFTLEKASLRLAKVYFYITLMTKTIEVREEERSANICELQPDSRVNEAKNEGRVSRAGFTAYESIMYKKIPRGREKTLV